jgi:type IV pilus assembly protein PilM
MARNEVWAIDIGEAALKAVKARKTRGRLEALAFDVIPYGQVLSAPGVDADAEVRQALTTFVQRNGVKRERVVATISARSALIRFIKLPPVETKKIGDVVQYEASQHIPFPLEEVVWDYQPMRGGQVIDFEVEVGMFAMRKEIVRNFLTNLLATGLKVDKLQLTPIALCNFVYHDRSPRQPLVVLDVGAANSRILVMEGEAVWVRNLTIGGNDFTNAVASKYKLSFPKAEVLKRRGSTSEKYAQQVFDALRTPARNLVDEVQRSLGFFKSSHKDAKMGQILLMGSSFALSPLARFIGVSLGMKAEVFRRPKKIAIEGAVGLDNFKKYAMSYAVALGLAVEELGLGLIETNMLPKEIVRKKAMSRKQPFAVAAAALLLASVLTAYGFTKSRLSGLASSVQTAPNLVDDLRSLEQNIKNTKNEIGKVEKQIEDLYKAGSGRRDAWLDILDAIYETTPSENPQSAILLVQLSSELTEEDLAEAEKQEEEEARRRRELYETRGAGRMTEEDAARMRAAERLEEEDEWARGEDESMSVENQLEQYGQVTETKWNTMPENWRQGYVQILGANERMARIRVDWGARKGRSWPTWEYIVGAAPGATVPEAVGQTLTGVSAGQGGLGAGGRSAALEFVGVRKIINLTLRAERRALTENLADAVDEIDEQFVKPLRRYPFFTEVRMRGNPRWVTYVEDMDGYRLGRYPQYTPADDENVRLVEWITFDVVITVDPSKGSLATATASAATTG